MPNAQGCQQHRQLLPAVQAFAIDDTPGQHHHQRQQEIAQRHLQRPAMQRRPHEQRHLRADQMRAHQQAQREHRLPAHPPPQRQQGGATAERQHPHGERRQPQHDAPAENRHAIERLQQHRVVIQHGKQHRSRGREHNSSQHGGQCTGIPRSVPQTRLPWMPDAGSALAEPCLQHKPRGRTVPVRTEQPPTKETSPCPDCCPISTPKDCWNTRWSTPTTPSTTCPGNSSAPCRTSSPPCRKSMAPTPLPSSPAAAPTAWRRWLASLRRSRRCSWCATASSATAGARSSTWARSPKP